MTVIENTANVSASSGALTSLWRKLLHKQLSKLQSGQIHVEEAGERLSFGVEHPEVGSVTIQVHHPKFYQAALLGGSVGIAEAYMHGDWDTDDLLRLVRIMVRNRDVLDQLETGFAGLTGLIMKCWHWKNRNTVYGSRRNIAAHYDLGNDFFRLFLDSRMMYSSAIYDAGDTSLEDAAENKLHRICTALDLKPTDHVLEIGSGWGGFAIYAAAKFGCHITTTTISEQQYSEASRRINEAGLQSKITLLKQDYRKLEGRYDKLVSIEMVEAVGADFLPVYFQKCSQLLKEDGLMLLQAITIEDQRYEQALKSVDFIKRYIFPGSFIPCVSLLTQTAANAGLGLFNLTDIGHSYAQTLLHWREQFNHNETAIRAGGYDEVFIRMWLFYLCYCEGGFRERSISDVQMLLRKSGNQRAEWLGS